MHSVGIVDFGLGNTVAIKSMLDALGVKTKVIVESIQIKECERLILPGVGNFGRYIHELKKLNFEKYLREHVIELKKPILGLCVGAQAMLESSEETTTEIGLSWLKGKNVKLSKDESVTIPRIGWDFIVKQSEQVSFPTFLETNLFYPNKYFFCHSYKFNLTDKSISIGKCMTSSNIDVGFMSKNIVGVQFHPERSGSFGMSFLNSFARWNSDAA